MRIIRGLASTASASKYAARADEVLDELGYFATREQLAEWRHTLAFILIGVVGLLLLLVNPALLWAMILIGPVLYGVAWAIPKQIVKGMAERRRKKFEGQLIDILGSLRNGLRSGRGTLQCIESIAREYDSPAGDEFGIFLRQNRMGKDISECAELLRQRMPSDDLGLVMTVIQINQRVGGNLSQVLERIEKTIRARIEFKEKVDAMTSQGKFEGIVMSAAPFALAGLLLMIDRELMLPLFTDPIGWLAWGVVIVMEILAGIMIKFITNVNP